MPGLVNKSWDFVSKHPLTAAFATVVASGIVALTAQAPISGLPASTTAPAFYLRTGSGLQVGVCYENGGCSFSGALKVQGVTIGTGTALTLAGTDARYVNQSGDTMTGNLVVSGKTVMATTFSGTTLKWLGNGSGDTLHTEKTLTSSGGIFAEAGQTISGSLIKGTNFSGSMLSVQRYREKEIPFVLYGSGSAVTAGTGAVSIWWPAELSGATLRSIELRVSTLGTTGTTRVKVVNKTKGKAHFLTTAVSIDSLEYSSETAATAYVVNSAVVAAGGDIVEFYVVGVHTTAPTGLFGKFKWRIP